MVRKSMRTISETEQLLFVGLMFLAFALVSQIQTSLIITLNSTVNLLFFGIIGGFLGSVLTYRYRLVYRKYRFILFVVLGFMVGYSLDIVYGFPNITEVIAGSVAALISLFVVEELSKK